MYKILHLVEDVYMQKCWSILLDVNEGVGGVCNGHFCFAGISSGIMDAAVGAAQAFCNKCVDKCKVHDNFFISQTILYILLLSNKLEA